MTKTITIPLTTITPIWTGDADRKTSYLRATSFLGGLRFWTEALLRSLGEKACSTTGKDRCIHDPDKGITACPACQIFGCTGLGRSFGMKVLEPESLPKEAIGEIELNHHKYDEQVLDKKSNKFVPKTNSKGEVVTKTPTWYLSKQRGIEGLHGNFSLQLSPLRSNSEAVAQRLILATRLLLHWGMLGAKDQYGYGLVQDDTKSDEPFDVLWREAFKELPATVAGFRHATDTGLPDLRDFYFFKGQYDPKDVSKFSQTQFPFEIRYQVRSGLRDPNDKRKDKDIRHDFCGSTEEKRQATKFNMGLDGDTLYGWGYFPRTGDKAPQRDRCLNLLWNTLTKNCKGGSANWKEFNAKRDNCSTSTNWGDFLSELANKPWR